VGLVGYLKKSAVTCLAGTYLKFKLGTIYLVGIWGLPEQIWCSHACLSK